jgi:hypothetical protein
VYRLTHNADCSTSQGKRCTSYRAVARSSYKEQFFETIESVMINGSF